MEAAAEDGQLCTIGLDDGLHDAAPLQIRDDSIIPAGDGRGLGGKGFRLG
jgi:hypothetical protein